MENELNNPEESKIETNIETDYKTNSSENKEESLSESEEIIDVENSNEINSKIGIYNPEIKEIEYPSYNYYNNEDF